MGDILVNDGGRDLAPWYRTRDLVGNNTYVTESGPVEAENLMEGWEEFAEEYDPLETEFAIIRWLPGDTYLPPDDVTATLTAAVWWGKAVDVSWMEMQYMDWRGCEVPVQMHRRGAAVMYVDDYHFGVAGPDDVDEPLQVPLNCVTDISMANLVPVALPAGRQGDEHLMSQLLGLGTRQEYDYVAGLKRAGDEHWRSIAQHIVDSVHRGVASAPDEFGLVPQVDG